MQRSKKLILGSGSVYRRELLESMGYPFEVLPPTLDERLYDDLFLRAGLKMYVGFLSQAKAWNVQELCDPNVEKDPFDIFILTADQIAVAFSNGERHLLHKPSGFADAVRQLMLLSGGKHLLYNAITLLRVSDQQMLTCFDMHTITMAPYTLGQVEEYVREYDPYDCVGGIRIQDDVGFIFETEGSGDDGITGLPCALVEHMLTQFGWHK